MINDDVAQKLALLPEGAAERNIQSWRDAVEYFVVDNFVATVVIDSIINMGEVTLLLSKNEQAKLFRAEGKWDYNLIISTADGQEIKTGEPFLRIYIGVGGLWARYELNGSITDKDLDVRDRKLGGLEGDVMSILQPMLDLLWNETRGKKNA